jgi:hypothetical protein
MSNKRKIKRNLQVLYGRFAAEVAQGGPGGYIGRVEHDNDCPTLRTQSMLDCRCAPEIQITKLKD